MSVLKSMTDDEKTVYRQIKLKEIQEYNKYFIDDIGINKSDFNMKTPFTHKGKVVVSLFVNEFEKPNGYYIELIDADLNPTDPDRTIYRLPYTEDYLKKYEKDEKKSSSKEKYLVPLSDFTKMNRQSATILKENYLNQFENKNVNMLDSYVAFEKEVNSTKAISNTIDAPVSDMTIRDYITIHTGKPVSLKKWINDLVKN